MTDFAPTKQQEKAIKAGDGPVLIVAGAGTGKTFTLTQRIVHLINTKGVDPRAIVALTFTEKAAYEMSERADKLISLRIPQITISTFHAFCDSILKEEAINIGLTPDYRLLTASDEVFFIRRNLFNFGLKHFLPKGNPTKFIGQLVKHISRLQDENISPEKYEDFVKKYATKMEGEEKERYEELSHFYSVYTKLKEEAGVLNFGDLVTKALNTLQKYPNIKEKWQDRISYLLIDEFQDTNFAQYDLIKLLVEKNKNPNLMVVADDDQSIYKFRGAAVSNVLEFAKDFPKAERIVLTENRRSNQEILDASYKLIQNNNPDRLEVTEKIDKKLISKAQDLVDLPTPVEFRYYQSGRDEAEGIALEIKDLAGKIKDKSDGEQMEFGVEKKIRLYDIAILSRAHSHLEFIVEALTRHSIPYQFFGTKRLFNENEIKELVNFLRVVGDYTNDIAMNGFLSSEVWGMTERDFININITARSQSENVFELLENPETEVKFDKSKTDPLIAHIKKAWTSVKNKEKIWDILFTFVRESGYIKYFSDGVSKDSDDVVYDISKEFENEAKLKNIGQLFEFIADYEVANPDSTIFEFLDYIDLTVSSGESPTVEDAEYSSKDAVKLITIHSSKGLEFPVVFLPSMVRGRFPSTEKSDQIPIPEELIREVIPHGDEHEQEERRLAYVAMTRAKSKLYMSSSEQYGTGKKKFKVSPFIVEVFEEKMIKELMEKPISYELSFPENLSAQMGGEAPESREVKFLSYSQIATYETCPRQYWYKYILKIPTKQTGAASYGTAIHKALQIFYQRVKNSQEGKKEDLSVDSLLELFEASWSHQGFLNKDHEQKYFTQGKESLTNFHKTFFDKAVKVLYLESDFKIEQGGVKVKGKIDRMDLIDDDKREVEIIDYKTGESRAKSKRVDKKGMRQLAIYALAAQDVYNVKANRLSLLFVDQDIKLTIDEKKLDKIKDTIAEEIGQVAMGISKGDFRAKPGFSCRQCDFNSICKYAKV